MDNTLTTRDNLIEVFQELGMKKGMEVMVHSSMKSLGFVVNGALDVIDALLEILGEEGTLLMPSHTGQLTDPAGWKNPSIPLGYVEEVRRCMKPFDIRTTPIRNRGVIPEVFLTYPGVCRSNHPLNSVITRGKEATFFTKTHPLHASEGIESPIGKLYTREGYILLIGVTLMRCTAIHLAEFIADVSYLKNNRLKVLCKNSAGNNEFVRLERYPGDSEYFDKVRIDMKNNGKNVFREINFRNGLLIFFPIRPVVDFAVESLKKNEEYLLKQ